MNIIETIGNTPLVELKEKGVFAKLEFFNPTGSIKDRTAWGMLKDAFDRGVINGAKGLVEPTSGNTGISLAFLGAYFGIKTVIVMPENMSKQRIKIMESFGAEVILTEATGGMKKSIEKAMQLENEGFVMLDQFNNPANPKIHEETTAKEIIKQLPDIDVFVCGIGTGGTITGVARTLKRRKKNIKIVGVEPKSSPFLTEGKSGIHKIQGLGAGFKPSTLDLNLIDEIIPVSDHDALEYNKKLIKEEGIFAGISSGACYFVSLLLKKETPKLKIATIFADSMDRYV